VTCRMGLTAALSVCGLEQSTVIIYKIIHHLNTTAHVLDESNVFNEYFIC